jgi:hypothetical protein
LLRGSGGQVAEGDEEGKEEAFHARSRWVMVWTA